jgi:hypothetical protein
MTAWRATSGVLFLGMRLERKQGDGRNQGKNDPGSVGHGH